MCFMSKKNLILFLGYILVVIGFLGLALRMVGLGLWPLHYIHQWSPLVGFVFKICLIIFGVVLMFVSRVDWDKEKNI
jgi:hypothetical protein